VPPFWDGPPARRSSASFGSDHVVGHRDITGLRSYSTLQLVGIVLPIGYLEGDDPITGNNRAIYRFLCISTVRQGSKQLQFVITKVTRVLL
jgi:hypothetical protein